MPTPEEAHAAHALADRKRELADPHIARYQHGVYTLTELIEALIEIDVTTH